MKRTIAIAISVCIIITMFSSCQTKKEVAQTNEELNLYLDKSMSVGVHDKAISIFKSKYPNVKVNTEFYVSMEDGRAALDAYQLDLATRLMSGKGPDVVLMDQPFLTINNLNKIIDNNIFKPLDEFISKDSNFNESDYNKNVINGCKQNGKLFYMPLAYAIPYVLYSQSTMDEFKTKIESDSITNIFYSLQKFLDEAKNANADIKILVEQGVSPNSTVNWQVPSLHNFLDLCGMNLLDYRNKKINFDDERVKQIIEQYKILYDNIKTDEYIPSSDDMSLMYKKKEILFSCFDNNFFNIENLIFQAARISDYSKPKIFTINTFDNKVTAKIKYMGAIPLESANKQNAYNFIKILMSDEMQNSNDFVAISANIPINTKHIKTNAKKVSNYIGYKQSLPVAVIEDKFYEELQSITDLVENVTFDTPWDIKIIEMLMPYFKNEKTYDECMELIKRQAQIYVSE